MARIGDMKDAKLIVQLSFSGGGRSGQANLRISDDESLMLIADIYMSAEQFFNFMRGMIDGESLVSRVLGHEDYRRVGKQRHHWQRKLGYGVTREDAEEWAEWVRTRILADTARVDSRQGGLWAQWETWLEPTSDDDRRNYEKSVQRDIDETPTTFTRR